MNIARIEAYRCTSTHGRLVTSTSNKSHRAEYRSLRPLTPPLTTFTSSTTSRLTLVIISLTRPPVDAFVRVFVVVCLLVTTLDWVVGCSLRFRSVVVAVAVVESSDGVWTMDGIVCDIISDTSEAVPLTASFFSRRTPRPVASTNSSLTASSLTSTLTLTTAVEPFKSAANMTD